MQAVGMWWSMCTVSTVGYGDFVPASPFGRFFGVVLMFLGLAAFSVLTSYITSVNFDGHQVFSGVASLACVPA